MKQLKIANQITKRETASFNRYLQEVSKLGKNTNLTPDEEVELALKIKNGDKEAETELIERNLRFVISVAKQYQNEGCSLEDLVSEGNIGLIKAARRYDSTRGCKFISYAVWWIRQSIMCYLNENLKGIRLPLNKIGQLNKIKKVQDKFEQIHQRKPTTDETIEILDFDISPEDFENIFLIDKGFQSLNVEVSNNNSKFESFTLENLIPDYTFKKTDEKLEDEDLKLVINNILNNMPKNHRLVIELYYGLNGQEPKSLDEIGEILDLTKERIRQIRKDALKILSKKRNYNLVQSYIK
jgi:RNA polymerase primary sigma factor